MSNENTKSPESLQSRVDAEMLDSFDEELEMELDDERLSKLHRTHRRVSQAGFP